MKKIIYCLFLLFTATACVEPIDLRVGQPTGQLVVEGLITDQPGPYTVRLTRAAAYNQKLNSTNTGVLNASVSILDDRGTTIDLFETGGGNYTTPPYFQGETGHTYTLRVLVEEKEYLSQPELLKAVPVIDSIYTEYHNGQDGQQVGFHVFIDTKDPVGTDDYFRWTWTHYEPIAICRSTEVEDFYCCTSCWDIERYFNYIVLGADTYVKDKAIRKQPITVAPYTTISTYFIDVEQYSLSKAAYNFWKGVEKQSKNVGGTFDAPPAAITGNMYNAQDPDEVVLGLFGASAVTYKTRHIRRDQERDTPKGPIPPLPRILNPRAPCSECEESPFRTSQTPRGW